MAEIEEMLELKRKVDELGSINTILKMSNDFFTKNKNSSVSQSSQLKIAKLEY